MEYTNLQIKNALDEITNFLEYGIKLEDPEKTIKAITFYSKNYKKFPKKASKKLKKGLLKILHISLDKVSNEGLSLEESNIMIPTIATLYDCTND